MPCKLCSKEPVRTLTNNKIKLCRNCFFKYFERKVAKTILKYQLIRKGDYIGIALSGGKDSMSILYILSSYCRKKRIKFMAVMIDEGVKNYRNFDKIKVFCEKNNIPYKIYSFRDEFGFNLNDAMKKTKLKGCTVCGTLRRALLNKKARELGFTKLVTGHNLDDEAQSVLMNQFKGNLERSSRLGPISGSIKDEKFIPRIKPLYFVLEEEVRLYAKLRKFPIIKDRCPFASDSYRDSVKSMLNKFEKQYEGTKHAIINSFMNILPYLKKAYSKSKLRYCNSCGEPCSGDICKTCDFIKKLK
ncbi:MAG: TIGR00269 family protein [Candidatus Nanoarchaeia archaeon]|nr:TIGR00269 family protein [Candidatus Nanoarchaeia archaeon]